MEDVKKMPEQHESFTEEELKEEEGVPSQILIVDDQTFNLFAAKLIVDGFGYKSDTALNGQEAMEII